MPKKSMVNKCIFLMQLTREKKLTIISKMIQRFIRITLACDIPYSVSIGEGTYFAHNGLGVVIHSKSIIGDNCKFLHNVTVGGRNNRGCPIIEDNVFIGAGACILGGITIGKGAVTGANTVVLKNVPPNAVVVGIPGEIIKIND